MAATPPLLSHQALHIKSVKHLSENSHLKTIPSNYAYSTSAIENSASDPEDSIPIIDFSLLTSQDPHQRSRVVGELGKACQDWGFFMVVNHGIPESVMKEVMKKCEEFFNMSEEEKMKYNGKHHLEPIRYGTSFNASKDRVFFWRDFLKVFVHPNFHSPSKPQGFSELLSEYSRRSREVATKLLGGVSESLGLEESYIEKTLNLDSGLQLFVANYYPPCPQPEVAIGMPPHSDHGLITFLIDNGIGGLQIQHKGKWIKVNSLPNAILINTGDHLEILSNGKYKSVLHRAVLNSQVTRMSLGFANGPSLETIVSPATQLVTQEGKCGPAYTGITYKDYLELQQNNQLKGKSCLDRLRTLENMISD